MPGKYNQFRALHYTEAPDNNTISEQGVLLLQRERAATAAAPNIARLSLENIINQLKNIYLFSF